MKKRPAGRPFEPGKSGNPSGRPKETEQEKVVKLLTRETFADLVQKMMTLTKEELEDLLASSLPYEAELFIRHMLKLGETPDWHAYEKYLARRIGHVPEERIDQKEVKIIYEQMQTLKQLPNQEIIKLASNALKQIKGDT